MKTSVAGHKASFVEKILPLFTGARAIPDQKRPGVSGEGANLLISAATMRCPQFKNFRLPEGMTRSFLLLQRVGLSADAVDNRGA